MKNYPLLPLNREDQWIVWKKTYLTEINHNINALLNYNDYFIPDYSEKKLTTTPISEDVVSVDATQLDYNEFFRATKTTLVMFGSTPTDLRLGAGFLLVSKARNEGSIKHQYDPKNYFIQPYGYGSFFIFSYNNQGQVVATYDQYAEEIYGLNYMFSLFDHYPRFLSSKVQVPHERSWTLVSYFQDEELLDKKAIHVQNGVLWTDITNLRPMFFHFITNHPVSNTYSDLDSPDYGEEVIVDSTHSFSMNIDKVNIAQYNETVLERDSNNKHWPVNIITRVI